MCGVPAAAQATTWPVPAALDTAKDVTALTSDDLEDALMVEINKARADHGLRKIWNFDACTDGLAEQWGDRIARTGLFEHRDQSEVIRKCNNSWAGETLVRGAGLTGHQRGGRCGGARSGPPPSPGCGAARRLDAAGRRP
jgi:hypothetical protein